VIEHTSYGCTCTGKRCPDCERVKCRGAFDRSLLRFDGLQPYCRECRLKKRRESRPWLRDESKEANRNAKKAWRQNHREYDRARHKAYHEANREKHREKRKEYYAANREKYREQNRAYQETHRDRLREQKDTYRRNNLEAYAVREANRRARKAKAGGSFTLQEWHDLCAYFSFTCLRCGRQAPDIELTVDHVVPLSQGGRNSIENLQPLCRACNTSKHARTIDYRPYFRS
jgi:5-methylcytosine-specific restriction endonuclease McrA